MASTIVWTCDGGNGSHTAVALSATREYPTCDTGKGAFKAMEVHQPFDVATLNPQDLANAFGAGFLIVGTALVLSFGVRIIVNFVKDAF